jgi:uncharacterized protein YdhG (YjbR/CyaY superfamily)
MPAAEHATIDDYIAAQPDERRAPLETLRATIRAAVPEASEAISYRIPAYRIEGRVFIFFAGWKKHVSLYPVTRDLLDALGVDTQGLDVDKGTIRFPLGAPLPVEFIARIARHRADEVLAGR